MRSLSFHLVELPRLLPLFLCVRLTVSLPAVSPYREGGDGIAGDPGGGGCDLHLDTPRALFVVALQRRSVQR